MPKTTAPPPMRSGAGGHRADTALDAVGVTEHDFHAVEGDTQDRGGHLRKDCGVAHAEVLGAHADHYSAIRRGLGFGEFGWKGAVILHVKRDPYPGEAASGARRRPPDRETAPVGEPCRPLQVLGERARSQDRASRRGPGELRRPPPGCVA